jgi:hypothetical protein
VTEVGDEHELGASLGETILPGSGGDRLVECEFREVPGHLSLRVYFRAHAFAVVELVVGGSPEQPWREDDAGVRTIAWGVGYYPEDGIRHLQFRDDGYLHYPDVPGLVAALLLTSALVESGDVRVSP